MAGDALAARSVNQQLGVQILRSEQRRSRSWRFRFVVTPTSETMEL